MSGTALGLDLLGKLSGPDLAQRLALAGDVFLPRPPTNPHIARTSVEVEWNILWRCAYAHRPCIGGVILLILGSATQSAIGKRDYSEDAVHFTHRAIRELLDQRMADRAVLVRTRSSRLETVLAKEPDVRLDTRCLVVGVASECDPGE